MRFSSFPTVWYSLFELGVARVRIVGARRGSAPGEAEDQRARRERACSSGCSFGVGDAHAHHQVDTACSGRRRRRPSVRAAEVGDATCSATTPGGRSRSSKYGLWVSTAYGPGLRRSRSRPAGDRAGRRTGRPSSRGGQLDRVARSELHDPVERGTRNGVGLVGRVADADGPADRDREPARLEPRLELVRADRQLDPLAARRRALEIHDREAGLRVVDEPACRACAGRRSSGIVRPRASSRRDAAPSRRSPKTTFPAGVQVPAALMRRREAEQCERRPATTGA